MFGKKTNRRRDKTDPNIYKYGTSKIKIKNVQRALNSDIAKMKIEFKLKMPQKI